MARPLLFRRADARLRGRRANPGQGRASVGRIQMKLPVTRDLHDYWDQLKGERRAPDRADIDPVAIRHILADTFIIEVDVDRRFPLRLCGARVNALWLDDQKGRLFLSWWKTMHRRAMAEAIREVVDSETPLVADAGRWRGPANRLNSNFFSCLCAISATDVSAFSGRLHRFSRLRGWDFARSGNSTSSLRGRRPKKLREASDDGLAPRLGRAAGCIRWRM